MNKSLSNFWLPLNYLSLIWINLYWVITDFFVAQNLFSSWHMCSMSFGLFPFFHTIPDLWIIEHSSLNNADLTLSRHREDGEDGRWWGLRCYRFPSERCQKPSSRGSQRDSFTYKVSTPKPKGIPLLIEQQPHAINGLFSWGDSRRKDHCRIWPQSDLIDAIASTVTGTSKMRGSSLAVSTNHALRHQS